MPDPVADLARLSAVAEAAEAARGSLDRALRDRGHRRLGTVALTATIDAAARASAALTDDPPRWLPGAWRLQAELGRLSPTLLRTPGYWLARAHVLAASSVVEDARLGRPRPTPEVTARLAQLVDLLTTPTRGPTVVLAAVVHAELATLAPFGSADDLVARAAEHAVLIAGGVDPHAAIAVAVGHAGRADEYRVALRAYAGGTTHGVRAWILHCLTALRDAGELSPGIWREDESPLGR